MRKIIFSFFFVLSALSLNAQENIDTILIQKIRNEAFNNSKVMNTAFYLTEVSGTRLTGSPGWDRAANWTKDQLNEWGLQNVVFEKWGEFGKGWEIKKNYLAITSPYYQSLTALPVAYCSGTPGKKPLSGEVVLLNPKDTIELKQFVGKLKNKIVVTGVDRPINPIVSFKSLARRFEDSTLEAMKDKDYWTKLQTTGASDSIRKVQMTARQKRNILQTEINKLLKTEKPALLLWQGGSGNGTVFASGDEGYKKDASELPTTMNVAYEDIQTIKRLINAGVKVTIEAEVKTKFFSSDLNGYNIVAEIPGVDSVLKDEVVMLGAHLDSWHGGTGATDNAAGCAIMLEVVRILKSLGVQPRRTIRLVLWNAEEQGTFGSEAYVRNHFADIKDMKLKPEHKKISAYYNLDNGTGKIRGIYLQGNEALIPIFTKWFVPFKEAGASTVTILRTGGTDHDAFDEVGIPAFQFIQDPIEYGTKTHHTTSDSYEHLIPDDLKQAAAIIATIVYQTAQRDEKLPRKELPKPKSTTRDGY